MRKELRLLTGVTIPGILLLASIGNAAGPSRDAKAVRSKLAVSQRIEDVPCAPGYVWHWLDGRLHRCTLAEDALVRGARLPRGSAVAFDEAGRHAYVFLPRTTDIEGYACRGSGHQYMTVFHPDGRLKLCWLEKAQVIDGISCAAPSFWFDVIRRRSSGVSFNQDGTLQTCRATRAPVSGRR